MIRRKNKQSIDLESVPLFEGLAETELNAVSELGTVISYEPGSVLIEEGGFSHHVFVVMHGSAEVTQDGRSLATVSAGGVLGEAALLDWWMPPKERRAEFASGRRTATVTASSDQALRTLVFEQRAFDELRRQAPAVAQRLFEAVRHESRPGRVARTDESS